MIAPTPSTVQNVTRSVDRSDVARKARSRRLRLVVGAVLLNIFLIFIVTVSPRAIWRFAVDEFLSPYLDSATSSNSTTWATVTRLDAGAHSGVLRVSREQITTAEFVEVAITASLSAAARPLPFGQAASTALEAAGWTVIDAIAYEPDLDAGSRTQWRWSWTLEPYLDGRYDIPALTVPLSDRSSIEFPPAVVMVNSLLSASEAGDPASALSGYRDPPPNGIRPNPSLLERPVGRLASAVLVTLMVWSTALAFLAGRRRTSPSEDFATLRERAMNTRDNDADCNSALLAAIRQGIYESTGRILRSFTAADIDSMTIGNHTQRNKLKDAMLAHERQRFGAQSDDAEHALDAGGTMPTTNLLRDALDIVGDIHANTPTAPGAKS